MDIKSLVEESKGLYNGEPWFGTSIMGSLKNISPEFWNLRPENTSNSIASIVYHMINWRGFVIEKLKENASFDIELETKEDWRENVSVSNEEEKKEILAELRASQEELEKLILEKKVSWLKENTVGKKYTNSYMLHGILQHDAYHLGQINLIRSQLRKV
ncbi:DinB family protein [uncultured Maribacter sp.]|uniref:DinB family protein n=1 Tax=uncultured Maribacter sp. TaxID=431308 RepID=UPI002603B6B1|nr:DinB family protein [uncultured Maribacter sp.]